MADKFGPHVERLNAVAASPSRRLLAIGGERDIRGTGSSLHVLALPKASAEFSIPVAGAIHALCFAGDELLLAGLSTGAIIGWDPTAKPGAPLVEVADAHRGAVRALTTDPMGKHLASVGDDGVLRIYRITPRDGRIDLEVVGQRQLSGRSLRAVAIDPQAAIVAAAGDDGIIRSLPLDGLSGAQDDSKSENPADATPREMPCGEGGVYSLCFPGDGRIAAGCGDGSLRLCFLEGAVDVENRSGDAGHAEPVRGLIYSPELFDSAKRPLPRRMFSIAEDGQLKVWLLDTKRRGRTIEVSKAPLHAMTLVPAGKGTKAERRGGTLVVVDRNRRIFLFTVNDQAEPSDSPERIESRLRELAKDLQASSPKVRTEAIKALGDLEEDEARKLLDRALESDRRPEVRKAAAAVIGDTARRLSRPALRKALSDNDKTVRKAALEALTRIEEDAPLAAVRAALASSHADIRVTAIKRLPDLRDVSPLVPGLIAGRLGDSSADARTAALDALYTLEGQDSVEPVRIAMQRGPGDIRKAALLRLGRARKLTAAATPEATELARSLIEAGLDDDDADVRKTAFLISVGSRAQLAVQLRSIDEQTRKSLDKLEKDGRFADSLDDLSDAAGALPENQLEPLFAALTCRNPDTALRAARCLGLLRDSRATGALLQISREHDSDVRLAAVEALQAAAMAMPADTRLTARLEWLLDDAHASVRSAAFEALAKLAEPDGAGGELELAALTLRCSREDIRLRALPILVKFGGRGKYARQKDLASRADELLGDALDDETAKVRGEAFNTLWAWHSSKPQTPLTRGAACRHADIRKRVVTELARVKGREPGHWADDALLALLEDASAQVGLAALDVFTDKKASKTTKASDRKRAEVYRGALASPRPEVRAAGCKRLPKSQAKDAQADELRQRLIALVRDEHPPVHTAAIEAIDRLFPTDAEGFAAAFGSIFYDLRVRACELCGKRRDTRAIAPASELLTIPETHINRPSDAIRQRAARALADIGDPGTIPFYVGLLDDKDDVVREMGSRGLATSCRPGDEKPLVDALSHDDLPVRSWVAEGLARLGDDRAVPVLAGTLGHDHQPIRLGAIMGFVALGPDGVRGILQGLDDDNRAIQDLVFAVIVARDVALARAEEAPDLLLSALASAHPEIRFAASRILESRITRKSDAQLGALAQQLVGPRKPDKASEMKDWPDEAERRTRLDVLIAALASDHPAQRYAAAQVLSLRGQPLAFWREAGRLIGPSAANRPRIPYTNWESDETIEPRKRGWIRSLFTRGEPRREESATERALAVLKFAGATESRSAPARDTSFTDEHARRLAFGTYAGLVRQAPARGESDETHRIRRDSIDRIAKLAGSNDVGRDAVLPVLRRALSDPHHLVRKAALGALSGSLYPDGALEPHRLALQASAADVGRGAVDALISAAQNGDELAAALARQAVNAPVAEVRSYAMTQIQRLYDADSLEPWLIALGSRHADVRFSVVDRLVDSTDSRVSDALGRALESDHEDLRLKAATALARRGEVRTVDVLAGILRSEESSTARKATEALVALAHARPQDPRNAEVAAAAARTVAARIEDDPDRTADRPDLIRALGRIASPAGGEILLELLDDDESSIRSLSFDTLMVIAKDSSRAARVSPDGTRRDVYHEDLALGYLRHTAASKDVGLRQQVAHYLRHIDDRGAEEVLARLIEDREQEIRVAACETMAFRAEYVEGATLDALADTLRAGRRELVLPAAAGLASKGRAEAFNALVLVFKAGEQNERERAVLALGMLGDRRALEELMPLVQPEDELEEEDVALVPGIIEALGRMLPHLADTEEHGPELTRVRDLVEHTAKEGANDMRQRAITGLRHAGDDRSRALIERVAGDVHDERDPRTHSINELGLLGNPASEPVLAEILGESNYRLRHGALEALQRIFPTERTRTSLLALRSEHDDISAPAASFLARRGDPATLVGRMSEIDSAEVRTRLRQGLIRRGVCPVPEVSAMLAGDAVGPRADAAWLAGSSGKAELADAVTRAVKRSAGDWSAARQRISGSHDSAGRERLSHAESAWRASLWAADRLAADAGGAAAREAVAMADAPADVRCIALRFLANHGSRDDVPAIEPSLSDPDASVRVAAAATLASLAPDRSSGVLAAMAVADAAAMGPVVEAAIAAAPDSAHTMLQGDAGRQLILPVVLGQKRVAELVTVASATGKDTSRLVAISSLGRITGDEARGALEQILANESEEDAVRAAAFKALRRLQRQEQKRAQLEEMSAR